MTKFSSPKSTAIPRSVMLQSLKGTSILAARTWQQLQLAETAEAATQVLAELWQLQEHQETAIDAHAELADQLDAEIAGLEARMHHLIKLHVQEIDRLRQWREGLDQTILNLHETGLVGAEAVGRSRRIKIKLNPPSCEIVDLEQVPEEFIRVKQVIERKPDKKAIIAAWQQATPVPGTRVDRKQRVSYELALTSLQAMKGD